MDLTSGNLTLLQQVLIALQEPHPTTIDGDRTSESCTLLQWAMITPQDPPYTTTSGDYTKGSSPLYSMWYSNYPRQGPSQVQKVVITTQGTSPSYTVTADIDNRSENLKPRRQEVITPQIHPSITGDKNTLGNLLIRQQVMITAQKTFSYYSR